MKNKLKAISLFSGCGGADLGLIGGFKYLGKDYCRHPIEIIHASDINAKAVNTYNLNFPHKAICADVLNLSFDGFQADIVMGGFPCQNFSTVNPNKDPEDANNQLFWELAKVVEAVQPKVVIGENVKGFYLLKNGKFFKMIKGRLENLGYNVFEKVLNAAEYGVPQLRERLLIIGIQKDAIDKFSFPPAAYGPKNLSNIAYIPLKRVIDSLVPSDNKYYFSKKAVEGVKKAKPNMKRALAQDLNKPCLTITSHLAKVSLNSRDPVLLVNQEQELYRRFSPREAARIQSFPNEFIFSGSEADAYRQIGNAVPPVLLWNVMNAILNQVFTS